MIVLNQFSYLGILLMAVASLLGIAHVRPYTLYVASAQKIRNGSIARTVIGLCGFILILGAGSLEFNAPREFIVLCVVGVVLFPLFYQLQLNSYKIQLDKFKKYDEIIKNGGLHQKSRWWLLFHRDLPSIFSRQDRRFWINGFDEKRL
jgi:hypothetical protein